MQIHDESFTETNFPILMFNGIVKEALERGWISENEIGELCEAIQFQMMETTQKEWGFENGA